MMKILPYQGFANVQFGSQLSVATSEFGQPAAEHTTSEGQLELHYSGMILRYSRPGGTLSEITLLPDGSQTWSIGEIEIVWNSELIQELCDADGDPMECSGFIVLLKLGVAITGFEPDEEDQRSISVFARGEWDSLLGKFVSYQPT